MTLRDKPEPSIFRWDVLNRAQQISLGLAVLAPVLIAALVIYGFVAPPAPEASGSPHPLVRLMSQLGAPAPTPTLAVPTSTPKPTVNPWLIGIVAGHAGYDAGAVCADGLTEAEINLDVAQRVAAALRVRGYIVDVMEEFDPRLTGYRALLLLSIHADSCEFINEQATGFKVARVLDSKVPEAEDRLVACLRDRYAARTGMHFHASSITPDMTSYHGFYEVAPETPSAIIETGFLYLDRIMLTEHADTVALGIVDGIACFLHSP